MFFGFGFRGSEQKPPTVPSEPCSPPREQTFVKRNRKSQSFSTTKVVRFLDGLAQKIPVLGKQTRQDPMKSRGFFYSHFEPALQVQTQYPSLHFPIFVPGPQNWNTCSLTRR